jgi:hypothetical protein
MTIGILCVIGVIAVGIAYLMKSGFSNQAGLNATTTLGATDHFMNEDRKRAAEVVVQAQAGKTLKSQNSDGNAGKNQNSS